MTRQIQPARSDRQNPFNSSNVEMTLLKAVLLTIEAVIIIPDKEISAFMMKLVSIRS